MTRERTYNDTAGAAHSGAGARVARADADDGDGAAGNTDESVDVADINTDALQEGGADGRPGLCKRASQSWDGMQCAHELTGTVLAQQAGVGSLRAAGVATARNSESFTSPSSRLVLRKSNL